MAYLSEMDFRLRHEIHRIIQENKMTTSEELSHVCSVLNCIRKQDPNLETLSYTLPFKLICCRGNPGSGKSYVFRDLLQYLDNPLATALTHAQTADLKRKTETTCIYKRDNIISTVYQLLCINIGEFNFKEDKPDHYQRVCNILKEGVKNQDRYVEHVNSLLTACSPYLKYVTDNMLKRNRTNFMETHIFMLDEAGMIPPIFIYMIVYTYWFMNLVVGQGRKRLEIPFVLLFGSTTQNSVIDYAEISALKEALYAPETISRSYEFTFNRRNTGKDSFSFAIKRLADCIEDGESLDKDLVDVIKGKMVPSDMFLDPDVYPFHIRLTPYHSRCRQFNKRVAKTRPLFTLYEYLLVPSIVKSSESDQALCQHFVKRLESGVVSRRAHFRNNVLPIKVKSLDRNYLSHVAKEKEFSELVKDHEGLVEVLEQDSELTCQMKYKVLKLERQIPEEDVIQLSKCNVRIRGFVGSFTAFHRCHIKDDHPGEESFTRHPLFVPAVLVGFHKTYAQMSDDDVSDYELITMTFDIESEFEQLQIFFHKHKRSDFEKNEELNSAFHEQKADFITKTVTVLTSQKELCDREFFIGIAPDLVTYIHESTFKLISCDNNEHQRHVRQHNTRLFSLQQTLCNFLTRLQQTNNNNETFVQMLLAKCPTSNVIIEISPELYPLKRNELFQRCPQYENSETRYSIFYNWPFSNGACMTIANSQGMTFKKVFVDTIVDTSRYTNKRTLRHENIDDSHSNIISNRNMLVGYSRNSTCDNQALVLCRSDIPKPVSVFRRIPRKEFFHI